MFIGILFLNFSKFWFESLHLKLPDNSLFVKRGKDKFDEESKNDNGEADIVPRHDIYQENQQVIERLNKNGLKHSSILYQKRPISKFIQEHRLPQIRPKGDSEIFGGLKAKNP